MPRQTVIGLDIGTSAVRAAELDVRKQPAQLMRFGQLSLPAGAMHDGEIIDEVAVGATIGELWKRAGFQGKDVIVGVANQRVIVRQVEMPWVPDSDLAASIAFQVQDQLPIPVEEAILDHQILEEFSGPDGQRMIRLLLVAGQRDMIDSVVRSIDSAGLRAVVIDLVPFALLRTLGEMTAGLGYAGAEAIVDVGAGVTNIVVHDNGLPRFVRILVGGGNTITEALATQLNVQLDDAEAIKRQVVHGQAYDDARRIVDERARAILDEVRGSLDYYNAQPESAPLARVLVTGGGALLPDFTRRLAATTGLPAEAGHPLASLRLGSLGLSPQQLADVEPMTAVPVGLALGERR